MQAATWSVSYDSDKEYACRFRREFNKKPPDQKTITAWKKDLLETGGPPTETPNFLRGDVLTLHNDFAFSLLRTYSSYLLLEADLKFELFKRIKQGNSELTLCNTVIQCTTTLE